MRLMVFDLDTALCQTSVMDGLAMASAIKDVADFHIEPESIDSIHDLRPLLYKATGEVATVQKLAELRDRFSFHLRRQFLIRPSVVNANYQVVEQVNQLQNRSDTIVGLVTSASASVLILKSRAIGLMADTLPIATGDDSDNLEGILHTIQTRVKRSFGIYIGNATLVGDETWPQAATISNMVHVHSDNYMSQNLAVNQKSMSSNLFSQFTRNNWKN